MIFISLGSQRFQFNRLLKSIDEQIISGKIKEDIFAQIGFSDYIPKSYRFKRFLDRDEYSDYISSSEIIITHGGTGAIIGAVKKQKRVIVVPRQKKYGEHVDDHQLQISSKFSDMGLILVCLDCNELSEKICAVRKMQFNKYYSNTSKIIESIDCFINNIR